MNSKLIPQYQEGSILDAVSDAVMTLDQNLQIQWANQKASDLVNQDQENPVGQYCYQVIHGREVTCDECPVQMTILTGETQERKKEAPDGRCYNVKSYPLYSQKGVLDGAAVLILDTCEVEQAEKVHRENQEKYRNLAENTRDILFSVDMEGVIQYIGPQVKQYGFERDDLEGQFFLDIILPDDREHMYENFLKLIEEGTVFLSEFRIQVPDGKTYWFEEIGDIERDDSGTIRRYTGVLRNITERKHAEQALLQSEKYYRAIFETSGAAMFILAEDTTILQANSNFKELSGYSKQEVEGKKSWTEFVHQDDVAWMKKNHYLRRHDHQAGPLNYEFRFFDRNNELHHGYLTIDMIPDTTQSVVSLVDITDRKNTEQALRQSESYYRTLFETTGTAMCIFEQDTTISLVNSNFENISGYSKQEIEGKKSWIEFIHPEDLDWMKQNHYLALQDPNKAANKYEFRCIVRNGEVRNVFMFADFIPGTNQTTASFIDITERKQMEEKLKEMSFHDSLTGLYNRNLFEIEMDRLDDGRYSPIGIVVCDLDGLKFVNDTLGHEAGDKMLINTGDMLQQNFRSSDIMARIGGDEFAVLLTETDSSKADKVVQRLRQAVQEHNSADPEIPLSLSIGYALDEDGTADMHALFREADNRMYREKLQREGSARSAILQALTVSMEARDFNTENHCDRLQELAASLARSLQLSREFVNDLYLFARFHDLGKVGIPDHILFKPGPLTEEEWRHMRQHCEIGHRIASSVPDLEPIADYILKHHESWDGQGYPLGLSGKDIPLPCRILAIVDAYDAMTTDRPYRKAMTREEAIAELKRCAGTQFDPELVEQFIQVVEKYDFSSRM